jgi:hypothetical protein
MKNMKDMNRLLSVAGFKVDRHAMTDMQIVLLILAIDPTDKQKQVLDAFGIEIFDYNGRKVYPQPQPAKKAVPRPIEPSLIDEVDLDIEP